MKTPAFLNLNPKKITLFLLVIIFLLVSASISTQFYRFLYLDPSTPFMNILNLNEEYNLPTLFSSLILAFTSLLLALITAIKIHNKERHRFHWGLLSAIFIGLAIDESILLHEKLIHPMQDLFNASGLFFYAWVIPAMGFVTILALIYFPFWLKLPKKTMFFFAFSALIYISGAIGLELLGGLHRDLYGNNDLEFQILTTIEESLEMLGITTFIYTLLDYLKIHYQKIEVNVN